MTAGSGPSHWRPRPGRYRRCPVVNDGDGTVVRSQVEVPGSGVLALAGGAMWLVGSSALPPGAGTVVLAVGIAATVWLLMQGGRDRGGPRLDRHRRGPGLPPGGVWGPPRA